MGFRDFTVRHYPNILGMTTLIFDDAKWKPRDKKGTYKDYRITRTVSCAELTEAVTSHLKKIGFRASKYCKCGVELELSDTYYTDDPWAEPTHLEACECVDEETAHLACPAYPNCDTDPLGCRVQSGGSTEEYGHRD